jgi:hypothetical protein
MSGQTRHPGTEALADFRAGLTGRLRGRRIAAHLAECQDCASVGDRLAEVSAVLASVPAPSLPSDVERQITAAIRAEATARSQQAAAPDTSAAPDRLAAPDRSASPDAPERAERARPASRRAWSRRIPVFPGLGVPIGALVPALACVLAVVGYVLSTGPGPSGPSAAIGISATPRLPKISAGAVIPGERPHTLGPADIGSGDSGVGEGGVATFVVIASGTNYQSATLGAQVRQQAATYKSADSTSSTAGHNTAKPSGSLVGCVFHVTGNALPSLVDHARYESKPAYVIATSNRVWVVAPSCTATDPEQITSMALSSGS